MPQSSVTPHPTSDSAASAASPAAATPVAPAGNVRWPLLGALSWLVAPALVSAAYAAAQASPEAARFLVGNAGVAVGVLACLILGLLCAIGSRVRRERWPWVGSVGAVISALPLKLYLLGMLFRL
ncbi:hypothetical protein [Stenotrophomonas rhizophila]|uniref:hypothetical protein n=1 Tax=Stenotrophomonas rhizophila TaxID=216778 RepID=UPI0011A1318F|nr:hypothetical protein [Stenotrophomonas rhizophila]